MDDLDLVKSRHFRPTRAKRFKKGLFGGKPRGIMYIFIRSRLAIFDLFGRKYQFAETCLSADLRSHPVDLDQIRAKTRDHNCLSIFSWALFNGSAVTFSLPWVKSRSLI